MRRWLEPLLLILFVLAVAAIALSARVEAARPLPTIANPYVLSLREVPIVDPSSVSTAPPSAGPSSYATRTPGPTVAPVHAVGTPLLAGWATHYWNGPGLYAAAGPDLRRILPGYHHGLVTVCAFPNGQSRCAAIPTVDFCACGERRGLPTLLDLSDDAYRLLCGSLSSGICRVSVQPMGGSL